MTAVTVLALGLQLVFLGLAGGWRSWHQHRRTGDWGIRRPTTPVDRSTSALVFGGFAAVGAAPVVELLDRGVVELFPLADVPAARVTGLVMLGGAIAGTVHAQLGLGASWRVGVDPEETLPLVTSGPFAIVRNPIFTWMVAAAVGVTLAVPNIVAVVGTALVVVGVQVHVRAVEEPYLLRLHGADYAAYARSVGRFVPFVGRLPEKDAGASGGSPFRK